MDSHETITLQLSEVLRQVADSINSQHNELYVTLHAHATWRSAIRTAGIVLGDVGGPFLLVPHGTSKTALQSASESYSRNSLALPIRTNVDLNTAELRLASDSGRKHRHKLARKMANMGFRWPTSCWFVQKDQRTQGPAPSQ
ncbi:uncharacterized protein N7479_009552 [Penicillium vulpinum]|uniref:Uncharacterized protein n=1 Tax=Penicillium vulpinum TaxID=29845 RepID=A0A1V6RYN5_9EURO|nr:uncharacterized protein N7479_009552 [Penicillium vulpinum]KAJ5951139.1 hypothetical protein N7479_009552 [Penicillium vulpinum]OQE06865.1 hypothetical protein PENVUL_c016G02904 [Penicillium vulpinum]